MEKFYVGETITGNVSGHTAKVKEIRSTMNQIVIEDATGDFSKNFPITGYQFKDNNTTQIVVDLFRHVKADINIDDAAAYSYYDIQDGEGPDHISYLLYETTQYYWTFFILNEHLRDGLHNWPKEYNELQTYITKKYPNKTITAYLNSGSTGSSHYIWSKFYVGETITGNVSGHTAKVKEIRSTMNQIVIEDATGDFSTDTVITGSIDGHTSVIVTGKHFQ